MKYTKTSMFNWYIRSYSALNALNALNVSVILMDLHLLLSSAVFAPVEEVYFNYACFHSIKT